jgi:exonuclease SbcC
MAMKKIVLHKLTLTNFKGISDLEVSFNASITAVYGDNATGKTTLFDAFTWLLFGKDSSDRANFEVKTVGLRRADHSVKALISVNGVEKCLKRTLREKWVKRRGSEEAEFSGHETTFFINDVPVSLGEYQAEVSGIVEEASFKLVTNPAYFNSLKPDLRRNMLMKLAKNITNQDIAGDDAELKGVLQLMMMQQKTLDQLRAEYAAKRKRLIGERQSYPGRISEVQNMLADAKASLPSLPAGASERIDQLSQMIVEIADKQQAAQNEFEVRFNQLNALRHQKQAVYKRLSDQYNHLNKEVMQRNNERSTQRFNAGIAKRNNEAEKHRLEAEIKAYEAELTKLRQEYTEKASSVFVAPENADTCPTCGQHLPDAENKINHLLEVFNTNKVAALKSINEKGMQIKQQVESGKQRLSELNNLLAQSFESIMDDEPVMTQDAINEAIENEAEYIAACNALTELEHEMSATTRSSNDIKTIEQERDELIAAVQAVESASKNVNNLEKRLAELEREMKVLNGEIADVERQEMVLERFNRRGNELIEQSVNKLFSYASFRLFKPQVNGGIEDVCETLIDGVPYQDANHAAQINAGIEICNVFAKHTGVSAPIWVDNAEAVNNLHNTNGQLIRLTVTKDNPMRIE